MKYIQKFNESNHGRISDIIKDIERSNDWNIEKDEKYNWDYAFIYKKSPPNYKFILAVRDSSNSSMILYIHDIKEHDIMYLDSLPMPYNSYLKRYISMNGYSEGTLEFFNMVMKDIKKSSSLPDIDILEEWFTYLTDIGFKIGNISFGYYESDNTYLVKDTNSGNFSIVISINGSFNVKGARSSSSCLNENGEFIENNPIFFSELKTCLNRYRYYLGNMHKYYKGYKLYMCDIENEFQLEDKNWITNATINICIELY